MFFTAKNNYCNTFCRDYMARARHNEVQTTKKQQNGYPLLSCKPVTNSGLQKGNKQNDSEITVDLVPVLLISTETESHIFSSSSYLTDKSTGMLNTQSLIF
jgi:hypothetical protein